jgi:type III pantothenate kinase
MSLLLIDMGNSYLKWTLASDAGDVSKVNSIPLGSVSEYSWDSCERPARILVSCVSSPNHKQALIASIKNKWQRVPQFLSSPAQGVGVSNAYSEPSRLGSDRWAAMVAAYHIAQMAVLVVDAGTALTVDAIDAKGTHLGGLISPGLQLSRSILDTGTQINIDYAQMDTSNRFFGTSTEAGIIAGTTYAADGLIERAFNELSAITDSGETRCILTGGDAVQLEKTLQCPCALEPALVLKGLALIATAS